MKRDLIAATAVRSCMMRHRRKAIPLLIALAAPALSACGTPSGPTASTTAPAARQSGEARKHHAVALAKADPRERECLVRAMYFEANRSSESGLLGVGTVVMNRVESPRYPETICGVVGAPRQFATGVLTRQMAAREAAKAEVAADEILNGRRSKEVGAAKHFHMAGLRFPYTNMHYVTVAGGNAFYVRRERPERRRIEEPGYQLAAVTEPASFAAATPVAPTSFAGAPLAFAPAPVFAASADPATGLVDNAPLPPSRPFDLDLRRKTARAEVLPPRPDARLAALRTGAPGLRGSPTLD
jgi:spore germination cell wall hydrolase CwlJ-like protein